MSPLDPGGDRREGDLLQSFQIGPHDEVSGGATLKKEDPAGRFLLQPLNVGLQLVQERKIDSGGLVRWIGLKVNLCPTVPNGENGFGFHEKISLSIVLR
jgi:hypothetical protein